MSVFKMLSNWKRKNKQKEKFLFYLEWHRDEMTWREFNSKFHKCKYCNNYVEDQCVCYAR